MRRSTVIRDAIKENKRLILDQMKLLISDLPSSPYQEFLIETEVGRRRLATWVDLIAGALDGDEERFLNDQAEAGYQRAIHGFQMEDVSLAYQVYLESCLTVALKVLHSAPVASRNLIEEFKQVSKLCLKGHAGVAASFLRTREDIIHEKVAILQKLLDFTRQIVTTFDVESVLSLVASQISLVFDAKVFITVRRKGRVYSAHDHESEDSDLEVTAAMDESRENAAPLFVGEDGGSSADVDSVQTKHVISAPIRAHGYVHGALALVAKNGGMDFGHKDLDLLLQYIYIVDMALEKAFMVDEIEQSRGELSLLASKLISIKEEQRKILADDIHDTVAQALAGIGYKIQFCKELANTKPDRVATELESILTTVNQAIKQCRALISNLRPDLLDTIGLIPALLRLFENYTAETGIEILAHLPEDMELPENMNICVYRVTQEALRNVQRHADAAAVRITLTDDNGVAVLKISDNGKGFNVSEQPPWIKDPTKVGLLYMRQRVDSVGGTVVIDAGLNRGCTVTVRIPFANEE